MRADFRHQQFLFQCLSKADQYSVSQRLLSANKGTYIHVRTITGHYTNINLLLLQVYDGYNSSAPQVPGSPFCGSNLPPVIVGSSQYLFLRMYTDNIGSAGLGFVGDFWSSGETSTFLVLIQYE